MLSVIPKIALIALCLNAVQGARILGFFPIPSISHQIIFQPIWKELSLRGHEVTVITPNPLHDKTLTNLTEIDVNYVYENFTIQTAMSKDQSPLKVIQVAMALMESTLKQEVAHPEFQRLLNLPRDYFDLLLIESLYYPAFGLAGKFEAPLIVVSSLEAQNSVYQAVGSPTHPVVYPAMLLGVAKVDTFLKRWVSTLIDFALGMVLKYNVMPKQNEVAKECFGEDVAPLEKIMKNISMLFVHINPFIQEIRPNGPAVVEMTQMHIKPKKPLPKDLKKILDDSTEGVVYFSLGSNVKSISIDEKVRQNIIEALSELPYTVLWKWESDHLPNQPKNVITKKWLPQQDVLGHPNVKVFVTQGGLQSIDEAIANAVPLVGMPFVADQPKNVEKIEMAGFGIAVEPNSLTKDSLKNAIMEVAQNPKYKEKMLEAKNILEDQPMASLEKVMFWCEYVIRHKGAKHLRSPAVDLPLYQYLLLDVVAATATVIFGFFFVVYKTVRFVLSLFRSKVMKVKIN